MSLSIIIPVFNEEDQIKNTILKIKKLKRNIKKLEIIIIDDQSTDSTYKLIQKFKKKEKNLKIYKNKKKGLGSAIETGIKKSNHKYVCLFMADLSDDINDLKNYFRLISNNEIDAVFGTRFSIKSKIYNYPIFKLILNRIFNNLVRLLFLSNYNDFTNAFKIYRRTSLLEILPIISENFNVFLELPLKIISRRYKYLVVPISWRNRSKGVSKFHLRELGSMYLFTLFYCLFEKIFLKNKIKS